jgi:superfamily II DNA or RNA helicase
VVISIVETAVRLRLSGPPKELYALSDRFKFRPENYWRADSFQIYQATNGLQGWDGYLRPLKVSAKDQEGIILRGYRDEVLEACQSLGFQVKTDKLLVSPFKDLTVDDIPDDLLKADFELDEHQRSVLVSWLRHGFGNAYASVSSGKTAMFLGAAALIKRKFPDARLLYFTPTERLVNQVYKNARQFLPDWDITQFGGGKRDYSGKDMVISTNASVNTNFKILRDRWMKSFIAVLVDESHHIASPSLSRILENIPAFFRFGASDTTKSEDLVASGKIKGLVGPIRERIEPAPLIESGRIARPLIYVVDIPEWRNKFSSMSHSAEPNTPAWTLIDGEWKKATYLGPVFEPATPGKDGKFKPEEFDGYARDKKGDRISVLSHHQMAVDSEILELPSRYCLLERLYDKAIIRFKERNELVCDWAQWYADKGWQTLLVCTRTIHVLMLESLMKKRLGEDRVQILFSEHTTKQRDKTFDWLRNTPGAVIITPLVKEGVSIPEIRAMIVVDPVRDAEYANQLIGRAIRKKIEGVDNEAHITFFLDRQHKNYLKNGLELFKRLETIRGYSFFYPVRSPEDIPHATRYDASV